MPWTDVEGKGMEEGYRGDATQMYTETLEEALCAARPGVRVMVKSGEGVGLEKARERESERVGCAFKTSPCREHVWFATARRRKACVWQGVREILNPKPRTPKPSTLNREPGVHDLPHKKTRVCVPEAGALDLSSYSDLTDQSGLAHVQSRFRYHPTITPEPCPKP